MRRRRGGTRPTTTRADLYCRTQPSLRWRLRRRPRGRSRPRSGESRANQSKRKDSRSPSFSRARPRQPSNHISRSCARQRPLSPPLARSREGAPRPDRLAEAVQRNRRQLSAHVYVVYGGGHFHIGLRPDASVQTRGARRARSRTLPAYPQLWRAPARGGTRLSRPLAGPPSLTAPLAECSPAVPA